MQKLRLVTATYKRIELGSVSLAQSETNAVSKNSKSKNSNVINV